MGENKHIEEIDAFAKKYVKEIPQESPSLSFTANLMQSISQLESVKSTTRYQPLISKKAWFIVLSAVIAILFIPLNSSKEGLFTLPEFNLSFLEKFRYSGVIENLSISNTTFAITVVFGILVTIQIIYLKGFFEKRLH